MHDYGGDDERWRFQGLSSPLLSSIQAMNE